MDVVDVVLAVVVGMGSFMVVGGGGVGSFRSLSPHAPAAIAAASAATSDSAHAPRFIFNAFRNGSLITPPPRRCDRRKQPMVIA
ncbi:hypothetical protein CQY20_09285 [Mycolicibacterium agri]|uniref:Uncharacterized protein n=1 Tax=Mycolicibacterium agri TaxID=36811 RepID=A0A2A7N796_MYCAG|nr:hypothetical protein [Mycolicibacterium agri]PEG39736.1 hypothetical protein CQY20_09285 [Mycolicibacterium agri]GFG52555.1 hypothetical protein MAGR_39960 [Mycolicibacterium agri]